MKPKDRYHDCHVNHILFAIQNLEDISGPDNLEGYILVLEEVKRNIETRILTATFRLQDPEDPMGDGSIPRVWP